MSRVSVLILSRQKSTTEAGGLICFEGSVFGCINVRLPISKVDHPQLGRTLAIRAFQKLNFDNSEILNAETFLRVLKSRGSNAVQPFGGRESDEVKDPGEDGGRDGRAQEERQEEVVEHVDDEEERKEGVTVDIESVQPLNGPRVFGLNRCNLLGCVLCSKSLLQL